jgi:hypothetical protein
MRPFVILILIGFFFSSVQAQVNGGRTMFESVNIPTNAHLAGLSGTNVSVLDRDPNLLWGNPALLNKKMDKVLSVNYSPYVANIKSYALTTAYHLNKAGPIGFSLKYLNYGDLEQRDANAVYQGTFNSRDYVLAVSKSYTIGVITLGANAKWMGSQIDGYSAYAFAMDFGALFKHPDKEFTVGLAVKNLGKVYKKYTSVSSDSLPFDVQLGVSYKPEHAPLRISLTGHHLTRWDVVYNDPSQPTKVDQNGQPVQKNIKNVDRLLRHLNLAIEVFPVKFVHIRVAYNYMMSRELSLTDGISTAGLSFGGSVRWDRFEAAYTYSLVSKAGGMNVFTVNVDMGNGFKKAD